MFERVDEDLLMAFEGVDPLKEIMFVLFKLSVVIIGIPPSETSTET